MKRRDLLKIAAQLPILSMAGGAFSASAKPWKHSLWPDIFERMPAAMADLARAPGHEVQIVYTQIDRDALGAVHLNEHRYALAPRRWFPAMSLAKFPLALLAAQTLQSSGLDFETQLAPAGAALSGEWPEDEPVAEAFSRSLRRIFAVSENPPFNRLYDFLGADAIASRLGALGYGHVRLISRLGSPIADNRHTRAGRLLAATGAVLGDWPERMAQQRRFPFGLASKGSGWQDSEGHIVPGPHDFSQGNFLPLADSHRMLQALVFPDSVARQQRWALDPARRLQILQAMSLMPRESTDPVYPENEFYDGYARMLVLGDSRNRKPDSLKMFGKMGQAYGFLSDAQYIAEPDRGVEFLLSAVIYVNADGIFNDDKYEYDSLGIPFLAALGRAVLDVERMRPRRHRARFDHLPSNDRSPG